MSASRDGPLVIPWFYTSKTQVPVRAFDELDEWRRYVENLRLADCVWPAALQKYERALKLYYLAWLDADLIKAAELVALTALELALRERYLKKIIAHGGDRGPKGNKVSLRALLQYMVEQDDLSDDKLPCVHQYGGSVVRNLYESDQERNKRTHMSVGKNYDKMQIVAEPPITLDMIRNKAAHGDPFDGMPWGGLFEVVHDLIEYASRDRMTTELWPAVSAVQGL